jgi:hypothetical protein
MANPEAVLEEFFQKRVRLMGGWSVKLAPMEAGIPDRLVIFPGGRIYLVELKTETGRLEDIQKHMHYVLLERYSVRVHTLYGRDGVLSWIRSVVRAVDPVSKPGPKPGQRVG